jgi:hypothetical protein
MHPTIQRFLDELDQQPHVLGVILFGSWARGNNRPDSDVDLIVVVTDGQRRCVEYRDGQAFEITYTTEQGALDYWQSHRDDTAALWDVAKVLYDKDGTIARLRGECSRLLAAGKQPLDSFQRAHSRFDAEDQLRCVESLLQSDPTTANMILTNTVFGLTELFFDIRQSWTPPPKQRLAKLKIVSPELYGFLVDFYAEGVTLKQRTQIARNILTFVFDA